METNGHIRGGRAPLDPDQFEIACRVGGIPADWSPYLPPPDDLNRVPILLDLCIRCLEVFFITRGPAGAPAHEIPAKDPGRAEYYLERFPELGGSEPDAVELKARELHRRGEREVHNPGPRFEAVRDVLLTRLQELWSQAGEDLAEEPDLPRVDGYEIIRRLGEGGNGVVYEARLRKVQRTVALKLLRDGRVSWPKAQARFLLEAQALVTFDHPHIVPIYDIGECDGRAYYTMKLVSGGSLVRRLGWYKDHPREAAHLVAGAAEAIAHVHERGALHRDLKPGNILVDDDGCPYVTDFGLAKLLEGDSTLTDTGTPIGTPAYMSPEQAEGQPEHVTVATDVYGLGAILYALLTERGPFDGLPPLETLRQVVNNQPKPPRFFNQSVPDALETICLKCLEKEPRRRYRSAQALVEDLHNWLGSRPITARPVGPVGRISLWCRRNPALASTLFLATASSVCLGIFMASLNQSDRIRLKLDQLATAAPGELPHILGELRPDRNRAAAILRDRLGAEQTSVNTASRYRLALVDFTGQPDSLPSLTEDLTRVRPDELAIMTETLARQLTIPPLRDDWCAVLVARLWGLATSNTRNADERFKAACALAELDPSSPGWGSLSANVASWLVQQNPIELAPFVSMLKKVSPQLTPHLLAIYSKTPDDIQRTVAANALIEYARKSKSEVRAHIQAEMIMAADERRFAILRPGLDFIEAGAVDLLARELSVPAVVVGDPSESDLDHSASRKANAAIGLLYRSGKWARLVLPQLQESTSPVQRTRLVSRMSWLKERAGHLVHLLHDPSIGPSALQSVLEGLAAFPIDEIEPRDRVAVHRAAKSFYHQHADPGVHSAAGLLLRRWFGPRTTGVLDSQLALHESQLKTHLAGRPPGPTWYVARGSDPSDLYPLTLVVIPRPGEVDLAPIDDPTLAGDKQTQDREFHRRARIERDFAVAAFEVRLVELRRFAKDHLHRNIHGPGCDYPVNSVSWYKALEYCQWLNEFHGIPESEWCFPKGTVFRPGLLLPDGYLHRTGYRLLTEAEWEYACRAGTRISRYFGPTDLMGLHACYPANSQSERMQQVGSFLPNRLGLHDMLGNALEWTLEPSTKWRPRLLGDSQQTEVPSFIDEEYAAVVSEDLARKHIMRGGSFYNPPSRIRASYRYYYQPQAALENLGFRVGRTLPSIAR